MARTDGENAGNSRTTLIALLTVDSLFLASNVVFLWAGGIPKILDVGRELNLPTLWSAIQLCVAGTSILLVAARTRGRSALSLAALGAFFGAMSADEAFSLHERVGDLLDSTSRISGPFVETGVWFYVLGIPAAITFGLLLWSLAATVRQIRGETLYRLALGMAVLLSGATIIEALTNFTVSVDAAGNAVKGAHYAYMVILEEGLEMIGGSILAWAGLSFLRNGPRTSRRLPDRDRSIPPATQPS